jgi:hypothetical protein
MASELLNRYEIRNKRLALVGGDVSVREKEKYKQKSKLKSTAEGMGLDILVGVLGGGVASALLGKYSFLVGLGVSGIGHFSENKTLTALGLGMMASGTFTALTSKQQDEKKPLPDRIKERLEAFQDELKRKVFLDKISLGNNSESKKEAVADITKKETTATTALKEDVSGIKKQSSVNLEGIPLADIERARKQATAEFEKEYAEYQKMMAEKQAAKTKVDVSKTADTKTGNVFPNTKQAAQDYSSAKNVAMDKALEDELSLVESEYNPLY